MHGIGTPPVMPLQLAAGNRPVAFPLADGGSGVAALRAAGHFRDRT